MSLKRKRAPINSDQMIIKKRKSREHTGSKAETPLARTLFCVNHMKEWTSSEHLKYGGLLVRRARKWDAFQDWVDKVANDEIFGREEQIMAPPIRNGSCEELRSRLKTTASKLFQIAKEKSRPFPKELAKQIESDILEIGDVLGKIACGVPFLQAKIELQGENICGRWHRDHYVGRAIVTYTGANATQYTSPSNVNFWELQNCGNNDHIIRDKKKTAFVGVGDVLFIKGTKYPDGQKGLVHKAPERQYHKDGTIINRLTLKVDLLERM